MQNWKVIHSRLQPYTMIYIYIYINFKLVGLNAVVGVLGNERGQSIFLSGSYQQHGCK
jgi:hypothetical protein